MLKIAITPENIDEKNEAAMVCTLISNGWDRVHLRHPSASPADMRRLIEAIPPQMHTRLVIHDHFDLISRYRLGGAAHHQPRPIAIRSGFTPPSALTFVRAPLRRKKSSWL